MHPASSQPSRQGLTARRLLCKISADHRTKEMSAQKGAEITGFELINSSTEARRSPCTIKDFVSLEEPRINAG